MPAQLWQPRPDGKAQCQLCQHNCVVDQGKAGLCGVRANKQGQLHSLVSNLVASVNLDPVEKKPLYHYLPGTRTYSLGTVGCNFACQFCQNHAISRLPADEGLLQGRRVTPLFLAQEASRMEARSIAFTYNEPTVFFELMYETAAEAAARGMDCIMVSNGFQSEQCLAALYHRIKAVNIDLKSLRESFYHNYCKARLGPVLDNLKTMQGMGWWLEVTTLLIPGINDSDDELRDLAHFIHSELGPQVPWHVSRFHGAHKMLDHPSTPMAVLERAWHIGRETGLHYVYMGNVSGGPGSTTYCPQCHTACIVRQSFSSRSYLKGGACPKCGRRIEGIWS